MLSTDRRPSDDDYATYRPIARVKMACTVCRLKKIRCNGKKPRCDNCIRMRQECNYPEVQHTSKSSHDCCAFRHDSSIDVDILARFSLVEGRLAGIEELLSCLIKRGERADTLITESQNEALSTPQLPSTKRKRTMSDEQGRPRPPYEQDDTPDTATFAGTLPMIVLLNTVDVFFKDCCPQLPYSFFHEADFRQRLSQGQLADHLLFSVLANGMRYSNHPFFNGRAQEFGENYAGRSWQLIVSEYLTVNRNPDVGAVQTVALLASFDFTAGKYRHGTAWLKIGIAIRMAQDLNMMEEPPNDASSLEAEQRRRVFWSVYILDRLVSCGQRRPPMILDGSCRLQLPGSERAYEAGLKVNTTTILQAFNEGSVEDGSLGSFASVVMIARTIGRTSQYMLQQMDLGFSGPPWNANSGYATLQSELLHLESLLHLSTPLRQLTMPGQIVEPYTGDQWPQTLIFSRALFHLCYCLLNHPFLLRRRFVQFSTAPPTFQLRAFGEGFGHAKQQILLQLECRKAGCLVQNSFTSYCIMVAGSILGLHSNSTDEGFKRESRSLVQDSIELLGDIGKRWNNVSLMCEGLRLFADNTHKFEHLASDSSESPTLSQDEESTMWMLVDYSTMSSVDVESLGSAGSDEAFWQNLSYEWHDLVLENMQFDIDATLGDSRSPYS